MDFSGKITHKTNKETVGEKQTPKQSIRVEETEGEYPNAMFIDFFGKKVSELEKVNVWDAVTVWVNFKSSEYKGRFYNNLSGRSIKVDQEWFAKPIDDSLPF